MVTQIFVVTRRCVSAVGWLKQNSVALQGEYWLCKAAFRTTDGQKVKNPTVGDHRSLR